MFWVLVFSASFTMFFFFFCCCCCCYGHVSVARRRACPGVQLTATVLEFLRETEILFSTTRFSCCCASTSSSFSFPSSFSLILLSTAGGFIWRVRAKVCYNGMHKAYAAWATRNSSVACNKASNEAWHEQQRQLKRNFFSERNFNDIGISTRIRASASLSACVCVHVCVCVCVLEILNSTWSAI